MYSASGFYGASFVVAKDALSALTVILKKGEQFPQAANLPSARLYDDMKPLAFQVYSACNSARKLVSNILGTDLSSAWGDNYEDLVTFGDMHARIARAQELLASADVEAVNERASGTVSMATNKFGTVELAATAFVSSHNLPYMFFFVVTAYGILRKQGVALELGDYLGPFNETLKEARADNV